MPHRCIFGCKQIGTVTHVFPNSEKFPERFKAWVTLAGGKLETSSDYEFYKKKRVCDIHFSEDHRNRFKRLNALAIPTLCLPDIIQNSLPNFTQNVELCTGCEFAMDKNASIQVFSYLQEKAPNESVPQKPEAFWIGDSLSEDSMLPDLTLQSPNPNESVPQKSEAFCIGDPLSEDSELPNLPLRFPILRGAKMVYEWRDQVVVITGAATGIGAEVVKIILEEGVKHVAVLDINVSAGIEQQDKSNSKYGDNKVKFYECDVLNEEVFLGIFKSITDEFGYIDVLINNAGIMNDSPKLYKKEIDINVTVLVTGTLKALELMRKDKGGRGGTVINISSIAGLLQDEVMPIYYATKGAVLHFSNCIGHEDYYSQTGVRVLTICFGATSTPLLTPMKLGFLDPCLETVMDVKLTKYPSQLPESAAKGLVHAFKYGKSPSTWLIDADKPAQDISSDIRQGYAIMSSKITIH